MVASSLNLDCRSAGPVDGAYIVAITSIGVRRCSRTAVQHSSRVIVPRSNRTAMIAGTYRSRSTLPGRKILRHIMAAPILGATDSRQEGERLPHDRHGAHGLARGPAEVQGGPEHRCLLAMALTGAAERCQVDLVDQAQAGGTDGMADALRAAFDLAGSRGADCASSANGSPRRSTGRDEKGLAPA
jgi:hypothetical protein